jgi:hypothetical protein
VDINKSFYIHHLYAKYIYTIACITTDYFIIESENIGRTGKREKDSQSWIIELYFMKATDSGLEFARDSKYEVSEYGIKGSKIALSSEALPRCRRRRCLRRPRRLYGVEGSLQQPTRRRREKDVAPGK